MTILIELFIIKNCQTIFTIKLVTEKLKINFFQQKKFKEWRIKEYLEIPKKELRLGLKNHSFRLFRI